MAVTVAHKIIANLMLGIVGLAILFLVSYSSMQSLRTLHDHGAARAAAAIRVTEGAEMGAKMYQVVADAQIDRDLEGTRRAWAEIRQEMAEDLDAIAGAVDLPEDRALVGATREAAGEFVRLFEAEMMAELLKGESAAVSVLRGIDERIDRQAALIRENLSKVVLSLNRETVEADHAFGEAGARMTSLMVMIAVLIGAITLGLGGGIVRTITRRLGQLQRVMSEIESTGNLMLRVEVRGQDEIARTARAVNATLDSVVTPLCRLRGVLSEIGSTGNLTLRAEGKGPEEIIETAKAVNALLDSLEAAFHEIRDAAGQVNDLASQLNAASQSMASGAEEQSSSVEEITANLEETESQVRANTDAADTANQLVGGSSEAAVRGQAKMGAMLAAMNGISGSAQNVGKIIKVIEEIAFQTNLLALNAAVEAARAGQHGRGFAVVAQEVRNLAGRSAKAARETAELIADAVRRVEAGVQIAGETGAALDHIVGSVVKIKDLMGEIAAASGEQARGTTQISVAIVSVSKAAQEGSQQAEELASSAEELSAAATRMIDQVRRYKLSERPRAGGGKAGAAQALSPEIIAMVKEMIAAQAREHEPVREHHAAPAVASMPVLVRKSPKAILPLDHDERGFGDF